ncbi:hypothetical protein WME94_00815 [Sorangium sp. So ce429]
MLPDIHHPRSRFVTLGAGLICLSVSIGCGDDNCAASVSIGCGDDNCAASTGSGSDPSSTGPSGGAQAMIQIDIDKKGLDAIHAAGQSVALVKGGASPGGATVAWLTFQPFQTNQVTWTESYDVYATTTLLAPNAVILVNSKSGSAETGWTYTLEDGQFTAAAGGVTGAISVANQAQNGLSFGLLQQALVNNVAVSGPESAIPVLYNQTTFLTPSTTISIFLTPAGSNGTILYEVPSNALTVTATAASPTVNVGFDDATNTFYPTG